MACVHYNWSPLGDINLRHSWANNKIKAAAYLQPEKFG